MTELEPQPQPSSERVEVNTRALVHKVLARYPEDFAVFRELLQNADDAEATEAQIEFQTSDYVTHSTGVGASGNVNENMGIMSIPDWNTIKLSKWIIRNDGNTFVDQDWDRLTTIGDGNPGLQKVGAFGVGFYSVFSFTDRPLVESGGKRLSMFFLDNELRTEATTCLKDKWTSIEMELREDVRGSVPKPFDLARFLAATMTFTSHLQTTTVFFDNNIILKIAKSKETPSNVSLPPNMVAGSKERRMDIKTVSVVTQKIIVEITNWALAAGTKRPSAQLPDKDDVQHDSMKRSFWGFLGKSEAQKVTPPASTVETRTHIASYTVYSAEVTTNPNDDLHKYLKPMTKKDLPSRFRFEMAYFSKEQHDARAAEEKSDTIGSVFRGPQGLFPQLDGDREYMSRIFIGQSTSQTTGIGGHLSGLFIPTVERGSIDLTNCHIAKWNEELLYVGGFLARLAYETEINKVWSTWPKDELTTSPVASSSRDDALYVMRYFSFHTSTPDDKVSKILRDAFFGCSNSDCFPILSNSGIHYTKDVRQPREDFSSFMKGMPVLLPTEPGNSPRLIDILPDTYKVPGYKLSDVVGELHGRILEKDETVGFLRWLVAAYPEAIKFEAELNDETKPKVTTQLKEAAKFYIGDREVALCSISKFVDSNDWFPWLQSSDPLPPDTIPFLFTSTLNQNDILLTLGWQSMTVVDWLRHLISPQIDKAHDIRRSETYSNRVLGILGHIWGRLPSDMRLETKKLMKDVSWIMTNKGFKRANEAYFSAADNSPVVIANIDYRVQIVLTEFGVEEYPQLSVPLEQLCELPAEGVVNYFLWTLKAGYTRLEDIQKHAVFPCTKGRRYCSTELYIPHHGIFELGLPILELHKAISDYEYKTLTWLGFLGYPTLDKVIEIAGSNDPITRWAAFTYLSRNFDKVYESEYRLSKYEGKAFIPATKDNKECVGAHKDVYSDESWAVMGFWIVHSSVNSRMRGRLQIRESPTPKRLIEVFRERAPTDYSTARKWFAFLATNPGLTPDDIQQVAKLPIVPIEDRRMVLPRECFLDGTQYPNDHHYRRIFTFVDFGEHGNKFLKACGAKSKPDCSDIVDMLIEDPDGFFKKTISEGAQGPDRYLTELRSVAVGYDGLSEKHKETMKKVPIFIGCRASGNYEPKLIRASEIMVTDDMENRRMFGDLVLLAPRDELLEELYELMGSEDLNSHIQYNVTVTQSHKNKWSGCEDIRKTILRKLPIFLQGLDERLKDPSIHRQWKHKSRFLVRDCKDLKVEKRLDPRCRIYQQPEIKSEQQLEIKSECPVSAEMTTNDTSATLWLKKVDPVNMHDVAAALCRQLLKAYKKHDVLNLMIILETEESVLKRRGYNVDRNGEAPKHAVIEGRGQTTGMNIHMQPNLRNDNQYDGRACSPSGSFHRRAPVDARSPEQSKPHESPVHEVVKRLTEAKAIPDSSEIRSRGQSGVGNKSKNAKYCTGLEYTHLKEDKSLYIEGDPNSIKVWKHKTAQEAIPLDNLGKFQTIIRDLCDVFDAKIGFYNIFWHPDKPELTGFNRDRLIFLNLAHYASEHVNLKPGEAYIEWYQIIVHEIAHHETPFHDERHELIVSGLSSRFLKPLHSKVEAVREYFECAVVSS